MRFFEQFDKHSRLVGRMADTLDVDLAEDMMSGRISPEDYRSFVVSCTACRETDRCEEWLEAAGRHAEAAPAYCRNKRILEALAP
jgi:hypothetical protein